MTETIDWLPDGTPYSPRFADRYHSESGVAQARHVFLQGCGLPAAWAGQAQWRVLETGFGFGLNFLATWAAWRADPQRPRILHFVSTEAWPVAAGDLLRANERHCDLAPLAHELHAQWWGLLPGVHRLSFDGGQVLLTLCIGDTQAMLRQQQFTADSVYLDGFSPACNPDMWDLYTLKAVARHCRRGTRLASWTSTREVRERLAQCGFEVQRVPGHPPKRHNIHATFAPRWEPRHTSNTVTAHAPPAAGAHAVVIGAGLAGSAAAASLARRGWRVTVLEAGPTVASGASGLPAGVFCPHVSPDDAPLSRLSRAGVRATLQQATQWLAPGIDWAPTGVLEHCVDGRRTLPASAGDDPHHVWAQHWSDMANPTQLAQARLPADTVAQWHHRGGWIRPQRLVQALLAQPGITVRTQAQVASLQAAPGGPWAALGPDGAPLAKADWVIVTAGYDSAELLPGYGPLRPLRGQVTLGHTPAQLAAMPPFPVNGHGNLVPAAPIEPPMAQSATTGWVLGSTFERGITQLPPTPADVCMAHATNAAKLRALLPATAQQLQADFDQAELATASSATLQTWAGVRCVYPDRLPLVGPVDDAALPGVWVCTAMGARGLTLAMLCGELLAARLHDEPLPLDDRLAQSLAAQPRMRPA